MEGRLPSANFPFADTPEIERRIQGLARVHNAGYEFWRPVASLAHCSTCQPTGAFTPCRHLNASSELRRDWTRKAEPGDGLVRLAEALQVPLRERNPLLLAAGYAPLYRQTDLDTQELDAARRAVEFLMAQHEPYPVLVMDRHWNTLRMNAGAKRFLGRFPGCDSGTPHNGVRLVFQPKGLRPFIENWESVAARIIQRVQHEVSANPSDQTMKRFS